MAWTTPVAFTTGAVLTAAQLNAAVINNSNFLFSPPACHMGRNSNKLVSYNLVTVMDWDFPDFDTANMHTGSDTKIYSTRSGRFGVVGNIGWTFEASGDRSMKLNKSGNLMISNSFSAVPGVVEYSAVTCSAMGSSDYVEMQVYQNRSAGTSLSTNAQGLTLFWIAG